MAKRFPISLPPGVLRSGTETQSAGRFYDTNLVRWLAGALQPIGGWVRLGTDSVSGVARAIRSWTDNLGAAKIAIGTHTKLYAVTRAGVLTDITPEGFTEGIADSDFAGGYGNGLYGRGAYGTPRNVTIDPNDVTVWSLDNFGENLVCCTADDGVIYEWALDPMTAAEPVTDAPSARAIVVTADRILMALGADGNPRKVQWSGQENDTDWTSTTTNYAGEFILQTAGKLMAGRRVRGGTLLLTSADVWLAEFLGQPLVYGFEQKGGAGTGIVSQGAIAVMDGEAVPASAVWMGQQGFFAYNGYVQPLECEVADYVFRDINRAQISKVSAFHNADFGEVIFFYPSAGSIENDRYVTWNYRENWWAIGHSGIRTAGTEKGPLRDPLAVSADGKIYRHETGLDYEGAEPYAETGPFQIGQGDKVAQILKIIPDEKTLGDVDCTFYLKFEPEAVESTYGPVTLTDYTDVRFTARSFRVRMTGTLLAPWRVGNFQLEGVQGGSR